MDRRYKTKAIVWVTMWFASILLLILGIILIKWLIPDSTSDKPDPVGILVLSFLLVQYVTFMIGGSNLAKAKGYSNAVVIAGLFWPAQLILLPILLFALPDKCPSSTHKPRRRKRDQRESTIGRIIRYRRNAFVCNVLGIMGVLIAFSLWFLPQGLFSSRDNAGVGTVFVFVPSYAAILVGCYWWAKAKHWSEAIVLIGLAPVAILLIPYVRLIYLAAPMLLPASMVFMPIILLSIIAVLPDKSSIPKRKRWDRT